MPKSSDIIFMCSDCGNEFPKWSGQCSACKAWNTLDEIKINKSPKLTGLGKSAKSSKSTKSSTASRNSAVSRVEVQKLSKISPESFKRISTKISELDRTLSGGLVMGQVILLGGTPGIGKSTLLLQLADKIGGKVLYASGEESEPQIALRANRLGIDKDEIDVVATSSLQDVLGALDHNLLIVDSVQTIGSEDVATQPGSMTQIRQCAASIIAEAKNRNIPVIIVGHITKDGTIAGPKILEHMVDTVLYLEGDRNHLFRLLRVQKNRFGDDYEVGIFKMDSDGMQSVSNPGELLGTVSNPDQPNGKTSSFLSGVATAMVLEGSRPIAVEVQALTSKTAFGYPKRAASGFSQNRLQLLCAVIQKHLNINLLDQDVYINIASGLNVKDPGVDLAVCAAIISSFKNKPAKNGSVIFGEVGLTGEVRNVTASERRSKEAKILGFSKIISPLSTKSLLELSKTLYN